MHVCTHACVHLHTHTPLCTYTRAYTDVSVHARVHVYNTGGLILQSSLCRGSSSPWLELPEMLWNWRRLFLLPLHPRVDHPLSWQPTRVFLSALVFPLPQGDIGALSHGVTEASHKSQNLPGTTWGGAGAVRARSRDSMLPSSGQRKKSPAHREDSPLGKNWDFRFLLVLPLETPGLLPMPLPARIGISSGVPLGKYQDLLWCPSRKDWDLLCCLHSRHRDAWHRAVGTAGHLCWTSHPSHAPGTVVPPTLGRAIGYHGQHSDGISCLAPG